ncbi:DUF4129 domain-containing protein [Carbonactinospora thermoautotrophica]|uniref:Protein-glutamine gamma-glutamyltransferase-like C-terminal domain-containing protein n=3 Tax=Carbonactinospora thermoautotrophica TaxID=1469144 RepID=A0A132N0A6_9ACTN|nr:DUF4129 domain-containing protein [Carbonactinospora thermoautotrophica]KWX03487.1 hypothetical protein TH66_11370 [Carbonactinospora thermoautotrophica]MCX9190206.1 DUF4129 domain-containing protein [Carbonactinospora thermoautotrophica]
MRVFLEVPVTISREEARKAAERELADPVYHQDDPSLVERALTWVFEKISELLSRIGGVGDTRYLGVAALVAVIVITLVALRLRLGPLRAARRVEPLFTGAERTAAEHRAAAERHAAAGEWAEAIRERLRAIVRDLEERALLDPRPGRTADEVAAEAGGVLPGSADALREAARIFDDVWYGGRPATREMAERLRAVDEQVRATRGGVR